MIAFRPYPSLCVLALVPLSLWLGCFTGCTVALVMPQVFGSHMVLQRAPLRAKLWGEANVHAKVVVLVDTELSVSTQADDSGRFHVELPPQPLSWNHTLTVTSESTTLVFTDVAFGDVVLCLGYASTSPTRRPTPTAPPLISCPLISLICPFVLQSIQHGVGRELDVWRRRGHR